MPLIVDDVYDARALLERLTGGVCNPGREVVFLVGSALSAPAEKTGQGVPGVTGVIDLIESELNPSQVKEMRANLQGAENAYQEAFRFLLGRRGPQAANAVIRKAVARARIEPVENIATAYQLSTATSDAACQSFDADASGWHLTPGVKALGQLAVGYPERFGRTVLTTNFDPLIAASILMADGNFFRTVLHRDGNIGQTTGNATHIVHLHGYWHGSDTLHTPRQLNQARPQLKASLAALIRNRIVVVMAYGGWDDAFTEALIEVVLDDNAYPEIIWTFRDKMPTIRPRMLELLAPGVDRGRISFYGGVDCHTFLPELVADWRLLEPPKTDPENSAPKRIAVPDLVAVTADPDQGRDKSGTTRHEQESRFIRATDKEDQPPVVDFYVGRKAELATLVEGHFRVGFVTGIGGQGKSAFVAAYYNSTNAHQDFDHRLWRDCKEENFRFEDHILSIVAALNDGRVSLAELAKQSIADLATLFAALTVDMKLLVVFDNVDHYVDLERNVLLGAAGEFLDRFLILASQARLVFTCRPNITHPGKQVSAQRLTGLSLPETAELFALRRANSDPQSIEDAHAATGGHALWLDLLAAQVARPGMDIKLEDLVRSIENDSAEIPDATLRSIWQGLRDREQIVLQVLAETVRPTTALQIADYLGSRLRYNKVIKAVVPLRELNLIVVKKQDDDDAFELHPLIRTFIRKTSKRTERVGHINSILAAYAAMLNLYRPNLASASRQTVRQWLESAELYINADRVENALEALHEIGDPAASEVPNEFARISSMIFETSDLNGIVALRHFDNVFTDYCRVMVNLGRTEAASEALDRYEATLSGKEARYINLCDMRCYLHWTNRNYAAAIHWGTSGAELKRKSGVDTNFDSRHNLALAQRDAGAIDAALEYFLSDSSIEKAAEPNNFEADRNEAFYGNIGRCLQLMGQIEPAISCLRKSAILAHRVSTGHRNENQAYAREWLAELFQAKGEHAAAMAFYVAARAKWEIVSPPRSARVTRAINALAATSPDLKRPTPVKAENIVLEWIGS